ncbi:hypothetical protein K3495_g10945 [Podosphaera aphanis]|nr:hypothetical protein K3495_g10945 [Podosphaera aphanis]
MMRTATTYRGTPLSPLRPTSLDIFLLCVCPIILLIGHLFGILDPASRKSSYNPLTQSHIPNTAPSYFAKKNNIFNVFFVKQGWAWVTFSYLFFLFTHPFTGPTTSLTVTSRRLHGLVRYGLVTLWWICVTQWFFGPPIIDRGFTITGGQCELPILNAQHANFDQTKVFTTGVACKAGGGQWKGGHDISGHVFLLVLGSLFLGEEVLYVSLTRTKEERLISLGSGTVTNAESNNHYKFSKEATGIWTLGSKLAIGVAVTNLFMLLMTAAYFHTWFEKVTGLIMALLGIFVTYFLPRVEIASRVILSMPGL